MQTKRIIENMMFGRLLWVRVRRHSGERIHCGVWVVNALLVVIVCVQRQVQWIPKSSRGVTSVELSLVFLLFLSISLCTALVLITAVALWWTQMTYCYKLLVASIQKEVLLLRWTCLNPQIGLYSQHWNVWRLFKVSVKYLPYNWHSS